MSKITLTKIRNFLKQIPVNPKKNSYWGFIVEQGDANYYILRAIEELSLKPIDLAKIITAIRLLTIAGIHETFKIQKE